jgi:hypothetical protein
MITALFRGHHGITAVFRGVFYRANIKLLISIHLCYWYFIGCS